MSVNVKLSESLVDEAKRIGRAAEENPDLPFALIRDILVAKQEEATEDYRFG